MEQPQAQYQYQPVIPPKHHHRTLVLCFDGTGDQFDEDNSNVVQFFSMLKKDNTAQQMVYYQAGIGTYTDNEHFASPLGATIAKTLDEGLAMFLDTHVREGYQFLMQNYTYGDYICLFGFSRGAYTARALAGMLHKVGLLPRDNHQQIPFAWTMYNRTDDVGWKQSAAFKKAFSIDVDVQFLGVWDTVCSVGLFNKTLPFTESNYAVRTFRHAIALDERRAKFKANQWTPPTAEQESWGAAHDEARKRTLAQRAHERKHSVHKLDSPTDVLEVWFAGCHCDVGGGNVPNETPNALARIPLRWMVRQCFLTRTGIMFESDALASIGLDPAHLWPEVIPASKVLAGARKLLRWGMGDDFFHHDDQSDDGLDEPLIDEDKTSHRMHFHQNSRGSSGEREATETTLFDRPHSSESPHAHRRKHTGELKPVLKTIGTTLAHLGMEIGEVSDKDVSSAAMRKRQEAYSSSTSTSFLHSRYGSSSYHTRYSSTSSVETGNTSSFSNSPRSGSPPKGVKFKVPPSPLDLVASPSPMGQGFSASPGLLSTPLSKEGFSSSPTMLTAPNGDGASTVSDVDTVATSPTVTTPADGLSLGVAALSGTPTSALFPPIIAPITIDALKAPSGEEMLLRQRKASLHMENGMEGENAPAYSRLADAAAAPTRPHPFPHQVPVLQQPHAPYPERDFSRDFETDHYNPHHPHPQHHPERQYTIPGSFQALVRKPSEAEETFKDALCDMYDQLSIKWWFWWILELLPLKHKIKDAQGRWGEYFSMNLGRPRFIPKSEKGFFVHSSVKLRMEAGGYTPRAIFEQEPTWVD